MHPEATLLSTWEASRICGCSDQTIRILVSKGALPATRDERGRYRLQRDDVEALAEARARLAALTAPRPRLRA